MPRSSLSSATVSRSSSNSRTTGSSPSAKSSQHYSDNVSSQGTRSASGSSNERPILPVQASSGRMMSLTTGGSITSGLVTDAEPIVKRPASKKQPPLPIHGSKDPLYSLSSASIRARKNALEMENIQRASHLYADVVAKIKTLLQPAVSGTESTTGTTSAAELSGGEPMDVDMEELSSVAQQEYATSVPITNTSFDVNSTCPVTGSIMVSPTALSSSIEGIIISASTSGTTEGLKRMGRSGLLHSLVQQYFTLVHPQFMIMHKNHFLVRFWAQYGPYPEAKDLHMQILQRANPENVWKGPIENSVSGTDCSKDQGSPKEQQTSSLLLTAMLALVSRHIIDRTPLQSTAADKQRRLEKSLNLIDPKYRATERISRCQQKAQEALLQELLETDDQGVSESGENLLDKGEQYFQWATELLKVEYEKPSLTVVQSILLLREYAIMAGNHTQAYMYGGTAITMAMGLGWHHAHLVPTPGREENNNPVTAKSPEEDKAEKERQRENKVLEEERKLCWWHCFIVDRWMSAAYNRPVNIPVHVFDKTHLQPLPKPVKITRSSDDGTPQAALSSLTTDFWLAQQNPDTEALTSSLKQTGGVHLQPIGFGAQSNNSTSLPRAQFRAKAFFDQQCRQALLLDDILCFLSSWSEDLFVSSTEFEKLGGALDEWYQSLADWQTFPISGIITTTQSRQQDQTKPISTNRDQIGMTQPLTTSTNVEEGRDIVQSTLLGITFHTIRILLYRPFLRTNLRHPPCQPSRASAACAQSANAMTALAESLMNQRDLTLQPCLLMRHQFSLVTAAGIQLMNANLEDEPRLSTPAKINLLKTLRILRDADRTSWGIGVQDGFQQLLRDLFPVQAKLMFDGQSSKISPDH
ncbi:hypothetical protein BGX28_004721 [Mortierella sp. GBA30]|nr:hypothetical protein BGX28_004721 [Mortierella sp. GBA30]